jgi:hypothetical protein
MAAVALTGSWAFSPEAPELGLRFPLQSFALRPRRSAGSFLQTGRVGELGAAGRGRSAPGYAKDHSSLRRRPWRLERWR